MSLRFKRAKKGYIAISAPFSDGMKKKPHGQAEKILNLSSYDGV